METIAVMAREIVTCKGSETHWNGMTADRGMPLMKQLPMKHFKIISGSVIVLVLALAGLVLARLLTAIAANMIHGALLAWGIAKF